MHNEKTINACSGVLILLYFALRYMTRFRAAVSVSHIGKWIHFLTKACQKLHGDEVMRCKM
ncbi:MAG: hypothetical protein MR868_14645 [Lachnospiraceae bacterium]|nr:hypothetical protein [Lachnospiraceae bacterium]